MGSSPARDASETAEQICLFAATRPEFPWHWGIYLDREEAEVFAKENDMSLKWEEPVMPGDMYLAKRNTGWHLLTAKWLGEACIHSVENAYSYDFSECVKVY